MMEEADMDDDSHRMPMDERRQGHNRRRVVRWIPDFSAGTVGVILTIAAGVVTIYVDNGKRDERITALQADRERDRLQVNATLQDIKSEIRETRNAVSSTKEDVAAVKAQLGVMQTAQPARR
jgi:hypothetical protein